MKLRCALIAVASVLMAGCGEPDHPRFDDMLVDRFDVPACMDIIPLRMAGSRVEEGQKVTREYNADPECVRALEQAVAAMDFEQDSSGAYIAYREQDWKETVLIGPPAMRLQNPDLRFEANVRWEEINP